MFLKLVILNRLDRLTSTQEATVASPATSDLRCVEDELAKLSPIKRGESFEGLCRKETDNGYLCSSKCCHASHLEIRQ